MKHSESFSAVAAALAAAAGKFPEIKKNREVEVKTKSGGSYFFKYATLDAIVAAVRPSLSDNGLVLVQSEVTHEVQMGERVYREDYLETRLLHSSGEWLANETPILQADDERGAQAHGSAITYARRYGITQLLCVVADEDDDGNAAEGNVARSTRDGAKSKRGAGGGVISEKQVGLLGVKLRQAGADEAALCAFLGVDALSAVSKGDMDKALQAIELKDPAIMAATSGLAPSNGGDAARLERHKAAVDRCEESLVYIRYHLGDASPGDDDSELGPRDPAKAADEWRALDAEDHESLWLAPSKGGWFSTAERTGLRAAIAASTKTEDTK